MAGHDGSTEHSISGGLGFYPREPADRHRIRRPGACFYLGHLGVVGHVQGLAERTSRFVRCGLEHAARQHRTHGVGILSAVRRSFSPRQVRGMPRYS